MEAICISVTFLDNRFHGQCDDGPEWPPSPWRLFQALLAAAVNSNESITSALEHLESLPNPEILAPHTVEGQKVKNFVPINDSDCGKKAKKKETPLGLGSRSECWFHPCLFRSEPSTLHYLWRITQEDRDVLLPVIGASAGLTHLGRGIDLVVGQGRFLSKREKDRLKLDYPGDCWKPYAASSKVLRTPCRGSLKNLRAVFDKSTGRECLGVQVNPEMPTVFDETGYVRDGSLFRHVACFKLLRTDGSERWAAFDPRHAVTVAAWARGRLCALAQGDSTFPADSDTYVAGHVDPTQAVTPPRFSYLPLPSIGQEYADGQLRRIIIAEPYSDNGQKAAWARRIAHGVTLLDKHGTPVTELSRVSAKADYVFKRYAQESRCFRSITPVILPGFDDCDYKKAERLLFKAIDQAGLPREELESFRLQRGPFSRNAFHSGAYRRVEHFQHNSSMHVELCWKKSIYGPLTLGAGRHRGLGLFIPHET